MEQLRPGLVAWTAPHPEWSPSDAGPNGWEQEVRSAAVFTDDDLVLLDPLDLPEPLVELAEGRRVSVVLTCAWHKRSAGEFAERFDATVLSPRAGAGGLDLAAQGYDLGDALPGGVVAAASFHAEEMVLWLPEQRALFSGDAFVGGPFRFQSEWLPPGVTREQGLERLRPLLELPVEFVLVGHGEPVLADARAALERALGVT